MSFLERKGLTPTQEIDPDLETEITAYLENVRGLFTGFPNLEEVRLKGPDGIPYSLTPTVKPETKEWSSLRAEPNRLIPDQPTFYALSANKIYIHYPSVTGMQEVSKMSSREKFQIIKGLVESIVAPARHAQNPR